MSEHFKQIYQHHAEVYDALVTREDQRGNLFAALNDIAALVGADIVEFGAGTGRMTRTLLFQSKHVMACDASLHMLAHARKALEQTGMINWHLAVGDNIHMPIASESADVVLEGWSFGHVLTWYDDWRQKTDAMLAEMRRILRPGGTAILLETMGTGNRQPAPPNAELARLYEYWQEKHGFQYRWIRTDYQFESVEEASRLTRFFFGHELAQQIADEQLTILPECTGIWWRTYE